MQAIKRLLVLGPQISSTKRLTNLPPTFYNSYVLRYKLNPGFQGLCTNPSSKDPSSTLNTTQKSSREIAKQVAENKHRQVNATTSTTASSVSATTKLDGANDRSKGEEGPNGTKETSEESKSEGSTSYTYYAKIALGVVGSAAVGWMAFTESGNKWTKENVLSEKSSVGYILNNAREMILMPFKTFAEPSSNKLLPDMPPTPPGQIPLKTLVLDLEGTLCHSEWDRRYGWRTAKRPGVDEFLTRLAGIYEIVIFASGPFTIEQPIAQGLDVFRAVTYTLFRDATSFENGKYIKDISKLNRNLSQVVFVEDHPEEVAQRENVIRVKSFEDVHSPDTVLSDLLPFLEDLVVRDVKDVRKEIQSYGDQDISVAFKQRILQQKQQEEARRNQGLGGILRRTRHF